MATLRRRSPAAAISKSAVEKAGSTLQALPEKPREKLSLREAVSELHESITAALDRGYSYDEVVKILANQNVDITVASLKRYLAAVRKENADQTKGRREGKQGSGTRSRTTLSAQPAQATPAKTRSAKVVPSSTKTTSNTETTSKRRQARTSSTAKLAEKPPVRSKTAAKAKPTSKTTKTAPRPTSSQRKLGKGKSA